VPPLLPYAYCLPLNACPAPRRLAIPLLARRMRAHPRLGRGARYEAYTFVVGSGAGGRSSRGEGVVGGVGGWRQWRRGGAGNMLAGVQVCTGVAAKAAEAWLRG
jgi:hypothetical protein